MVFPDSRISADPALFWHGTGLLDWDPAGRMNLADGAWINFDGYHNLLPGHLFDWEHRQLNLGLRGAGHVRVDIRRLEPDGSDRLLSSTEAVLQPEQRLSLMVEDKADGLLFVAVGAIGRDWVEDIAFEIVGRPPRTINLVGSITTYRREDALARTLALLDHYLAGSPDLASKFRLLVIDNGGTVAALSYPWAQRVSNPNWGGSGGFAKGLQVISADRNATHALFMDDDARFFADIIRRTWALLGYGADAGLAISAALITARQPTVMFENGARFLEHPLRIDAGADLSCRKAVAALSRLPSTPGDHRYGAWWLFCFALDQARHWPFPFFVRGDDIQFSLANRFRIVNPVGIAAVQDCFDHRQTPLSVYLDTRQQVLQMILFFREDQARATISRAVRANFDRYNASYHYGTAAAIVQALVDVAQGPAFWEANLGLHSRRRQFRLRAADEYPAPLSAGLAARDATEPVRLPLGFARWARRLTLGGHLLPRWLWRHADAVVPLHRRGSSHAAFLHRALITRDASSGVGYVCSFDRRRFFANRAAFSGAQHALLGQLGALTTAYRAALPALASPQAWARRFSDATAGACVPRVMIDAKLDLREPSGVRCFGLAVTDMLAFAGCETIRLRDPASHTPVVARLAEVFRPGCRPVAVGPHDVAAKYLYGRAQSRFHILGRMTELALQSPPDLVWWTYPLPLRVPGTTNVYTVHDLIPLTDPALSPVCSTRLARLLRMIEKVADRVVTVSHASRNELLTRMGWQPDFVSVLYQPSLLVAPPAFDSDLRNDPAAPLVCIATLEPRKNIMRLLAAYRASGCRRPLVLCGAVGWRGEAIARAIRDCPGASWAGVLSDRSLAVVLSRARGLILPSLAEGFGRPLVEAMQFGLPIIASSLPSSREVAGDCALFFEASDVAALTLAIARLDFDNDLACELGQRGQARFARMFARDVLSRDYRRFVADLTGA